MYITKEKNYYIINCQFFRNLFINSLLFQAWKDKQTNPMMFSDIPRLCELWLLFSLMPIWKKEKKKRKKIVSFLQGEVDHDLDSSSVSTDIHCQSSSLFMNYGEGHSYHWQVY